MIVSKDNLESVRRGVLGGGRVRRRGGLWATAVLVAAAGAGMLGGEAPLVITLGGGYEADADHSEGVVGEDYLLAHGVPEAAIIAETKSDNTEESAERLAVIARANGLKSIVVVSDGTHLFRIHAICEHDGLAVYTSPRPVLRPIPWATRVQRLVHEVVSYT